jgi:hypothetical protein
MSQPAIHPPSARSWRDIPQPLKPRAMSREGRKRLIFSIGNSVGLVLGLGVVAWGAIEVIALNEKNPAQLLAPSHSTPVRGLTFRTDGVLDETWVTATLALPPKAALMALDLAALQSRLVASGQVQGAELTRQLPDRLIVTLRERVPVARVMAQMGDDAPQMLLVAGDGVVFPGTGFTATTVESLPFLDGVRLVRAGTGFAPIAGMDRVAELLAAARGSTPELRQGFRVVSLARLERDGVILVKSAEVREITFDAREDFFPQLALLDSALALLAEKRPRSARPVPPEPVFAANLAVVVNQVLLTPNAPDGSVYRKSGNNNSHPFAAPAARPTFEFFLPTPASPQHDL